MSNTEIYGFDKEGNAYFEDEIRNAWRGGMAVWSFLEEKYLPPFVPNYARQIGIKTPEEFEKRFGHKPYRTTTLMEDAGIREIWNLEHDENVTETDRICLATTFDYVLVKKENIPLVVEAFRAFEGTTSLKEQADVLERMYDDEDCIAVGWNQTSVNGDTWSNYGGYDEENDCCIPYNCFTGDKHWWLFHEEVQNETD